MIWVGGDAQDFAQDISTNPMGIAVRARDARALVVIRAAPDYVDLIGGSTPDRVRRNRIIAFASW